MSRGSHLLLAQQHIDVGGEADLALGNMAQERGFAVAVKLDLVVRKEWGCQDTHWDTRDNRRYNAPVRAHKAVAMARGNAQLCIDKQVFALHVNRGESVYMANSYEQCN